MSFADDYFNELNKNKKKKKEQSTSNDKGETSENSYAADYFNALDEDANHRIITMPTKTLDDDIAPIKGGNKDSIFKSGGFSDGVDGVGDFFVDLGQSVAGTVGDIGIGVVKGAGRMVEGLVDLGTYGVAGVADLVGADEFAEKLTEVGQYSATDGWTKGITDYVDQYSVLGNKADMVSEGLGQVATILLTGGLASAGGIGASGVSALTTGIIGASGVGSGMSEAYSGGASDGEALGYGVMAGTVEAVSELIFGGLGKGVKAVGLSKGLTSIDDILAKKISNAAAKYITSEAGQKVVGNTLEYAVKSGAEGLEEVISAHGTALAKDLFLLNEKDEKAYREILQDENLLEQFVVGSIVSGIAQGGDFVKSTTSGRDFVSGLSTSEQSVVDKVYEGAIAEKEKGGTKLTAKEKNKLYDSIVEQMDKGQLDIDTIESVLGGKTYEEYKNLAEREKALTEEISRLENTPKEQITVKQSERLTEAREELSNLTNKTELKTRLSEEVFGIAKNSRLVESYNERARKGQAFEADLTQYTGKQKEAVERAIKSGVLNNTYRSHELVDTLSKIEADKGITFDYTNNERLKESGFAIKGKTVNGFVKDGGVTLNVQSPKAWQSTVGHEITHVLEGTEAYGALREALYAYAESKGELASRKTALTELYKGMDADIDAELTADLVGDYLFSDNEFINKLTGNRTLFQKIWDEVKYLCKVATGKELTQIEKVEREFAKVWKEIGSETVQESESREYSDSDVAYSLTGVDADGIEVYETSDKTKKLSNTERKKALLNSVLNEYKGRTAKFNKNGETYYAFNDEAGIRKNLYGDSKSDKNGLKAKVNIGADGNYIELAENARYTSSSNETGKQTVSGYHDNAKSWDYYVKTIKSDGRYFDVLINVKDTGNDNYVYDITLKEASSLPSLKGLSDGNSLASSGNIISQDTENVNTQFSPKSDTKYSVSDSDGNSLTPEQQEFFTVDNLNPTSDPDARYSISEEADTEYMSAVENGDTETAQRMVDEAAKNAGYSIKAYHGTGYDFTVFDKSKQGDNYQDWGRLGKGFYFAPTSREAETWAEHSRGSLNKVMPVYLSSKNMLDSFEALPDNLKDTIPADWEGLTRRFAEKYAYNYIEYMQEFGYDVQKILTENGYDGINGHTEFVVYDPEQVKSADAVTYDDKGNVIPLSERFNTANEDIRYSLSTDNEGNQLSTEQQEYFKDSKVRDEKGNLKVMYHGTTADFNTFKKGDVGYHFGTKGAARGRVGYGKNVKIKECYINITNPIVFDRDLGSWDADFELTKELYSMGILSREDAESVLLTDNKLYRRSTESANKKLNKLLVSKGYDGIEYQNTFETKKPTKSYIVFSPNQIKLTDNKAPTTNQDIRFSLSESVEETKDLVAIHNLQSSELAKTLELGGLPMPSIAVIKAQQGHEQYGDVSLIFPKDTIDPQQSKDNKVYGGDTWTPTYPRIEYKANEGVQKKVRDKYYELADKIGYDAVRPLYRYAHELESALNSEQGEANLLDWLYKDTKLMQIYLEDSGKGKVEDIVKETRTESSESDKEMSQWFIDKLGEDFIRAFKTPTGESPLSYRKNYIEEHKAEIASAWESFCREVYQITEEQVQNVMRDTTGAMYMKFMRNAEQYLNNGGVTIKTEIDYDATDRAIEEKAADGYKEWVDGLFKGAQEKTGIRNDKDAFTSTGNRRSWDALHWENTLENVVKAMKTQDQTGADAFSPASAIFAVAHKRYGSVEDIKADSNRLGKVSEEEYKAMEEAYASRLAKIAESIKDPTERNPFIANDRAAGEIVDAVRNYKTKGGMLRYMQKWNNRVTESTVDDILSLVSDIANMPTGYFEAKPQRAVGLEEVGVFVIPNNADVKLKQELLNKGYNIAEYDPNIEGDRQRVVNQFEEYKFSLSDVGEQPSTIGTPLRELALEEDIAPVRESDTENPTTDDVAPIAPEAEQTVDEKIASKVEKLRANLEDNRKLRAESVAEYDRRIGILEAEYEAKKNKTLETELDNNIRLREESRADFDTEIAQLRAEYEAKKQKNTKVANNILRRIERLQRFRDGADADYEKRIANLKARVDNINSPQHKIRIDRLKQRKADVDAKYEEKINSLHERIQKMQTPQYRRGEQRRAKQEQFADEIRNLIGDTSTWRDKKLGISYQTNTLHRNLRDVVRDATGKQDIAKADEIYEYLQGSYNHNEARLKQESRDIKQKYADMKINKHESEYIQMLGEFKYNPDTKLTFEDVDGYFNKHKNRIVIDKVNKAIEESRKDYDNLIKRVNAVLREQGMKEIGYKQGYFPHFTDTKQSWLAKVFNWKTIDTEIPTDIAGLTEDFEPVRTYQSFDKHRKSDETDYNFLQGFDTYVHGALDWIYHIEDIQKRRAFENEIRYSHSEQGIRDRIDEIRNNKDLDTDEAQALMDKVYETARNPLNNFVTDLRNSTNNLAGKKSTADRSMEYATNRKVYSTMTNISNRVSGNMVVGSISSALTNFIPITQSWGQVSPVSSLRAVGDVVRNAFRDDGMIKKSDFMTNRLLNEENLNQTVWDKAANVAGGLMNVFDHFTTEVVWRSKYQENMNNGMSEAEAIHDADVFAENVMAGRSRGNMPTIYNSKNPITKMLTAFQLEVANQYGYMFKDLPQDIGKKHIGKLTSAYAKMFIGAYVYNALLSTLTGRDAAFDPISILEDLMKDLGFGGADEEEEVDVMGALSGLGENIAQEIPYIGGLLGGGRVPISNALPYSSVTEMVTGTMKDVADKDLENLTKEWLKPIYYVAMPFGGGQLKKSVEGLGMFSDEHPVSGSYTTSGNLRFPVEDTPVNRAQAAIFGQYSSKNAREYFDKGYAPLKEKQIQEYMDVDIPIKDYWKYRKGLAKQETLEDKFDYIAGLDLPVEKRNILINNVVDRKEKVDLENYDDFANLEEFDFATKNPEKYAFAKSVGGYSAYKTYSDELYDIKADKDESGKSITGSRKEKVLNYINGLDADYETKIILWKSEYPSDDTYNMDIINYLNRREDLTYEERVAIFTELGFTVTDGTVYWD